MRMLPIQPATALLSEIFIFHGKIRTENSWFPRWWFLDGYCVCGRVFYPDRDWQWTFPMPPTHPHHTHNRTGIEKWMKTGRKVKIFIFSSSSDWESRSTWWNRTHTDTRWWSFQFPPLTLRNPLTSMLSLVRMSSSEHEGYEDGTRESRTVIFQTRFPPLCSIHNHHMEHDKRSDSLTTRRREDDNGRRWWQ